MNNVGRLFIAIIVFAFAANEVNAQQRTTNNNNNNTRVVKVGKRDSNGRGFFKEQKFRIRTGIYNRPLRHGYYFYNYNRPSFIGYYRPQRVISLRNQIRPAIFSGVRFLDRPYFRGIGVNEAQALNELNKQELESTRNYRLYKYTQKPSKRNKKKLIKFNILTGRDANEGIK